MQQERLRFEEWIASPPIEADITRAPGEEHLSAWPGQYRDYQVQLAWEAWVEALRKSAVQSSPAAEKSEAKPEVVGFTPSTLSKFPGGAHT